ncbi:MAG: molybdopterin cofactor-binding domain-containing protein [Aggregatilineales bacterium]|nr:molybdopterin-dependent oxidoreductase [Chloroflexota bacterium]HOA22540.1 molybdopterin-dependent oxidoreductase [Aggregatilineales bacterium]
MNITFRLNGENVTFDARPSQTLLDVLRENGVVGVKHGCETGECGACTVLLDGKPVSTCVMLAAQVEGHEVETIEGVGGQQQRGWRGSEPLHALQEAFVETGAIQCGYCTPGMIMAAKALLEENPNPTEAEVREALSGVLCRCTGYLKPVQAVLRAAAVMRGEEVPPIFQEGAVPVPEGLFKPVQQEEPPAVPTADGGTVVKTTPMPTMVVSEERARDYVGKPEPKVDALKLVQGKPAFTDDIEHRGMLVAKILWSPHAHALIKNIDVSKARELPGVHAVLTYKDLPRVPYTTAGQSHPEPGPHDNYSLDYKVRWVGDRVAAVAAETEEIAQRALDLIEVEYEVLPAIFDPREAMKPGAPIIHDEEESWNIEDRNRNLAAVIDWELGDVEAGFAQADYIFEDTYYSPKVQQAPIEPHIAMTWWDEDDRLVIRTSTQVPFHVRRILAPVLGLPEKRIRVIKPRIGGGFGVKQEVLIEDIAAHLTIVTGRPVVLEYTREEEFSSARTRHDMYLTMKTGVMKDGTIVANSMYVISDTGGSGTHAMTVAGNTGHKAMALYNAPNIKFHADIVYTNKVPSGAYRGYGVPQGFWAVETHMQRIATELGLDPLEFRLKNALKAGDEHPISKIWSEGREGAVEYIHTCGLPECVEQGAEAIRWYERWGNPEWHEVPGKPHLRRGIGVAMVMQGTAIPNLDMGAASIKMNDDGSFNLLVGATDLGTGSDTVLTQMAAEVLGCPPEDFVTYSSDTDFTPFDKGAYASSTTYISGKAVVLAAEKVAAQIKQVAARMLSSEGETVSADELTLRDRAVWAEDGRYVTLRDVALNSLHHENQHQIMATASYVSPESPPPFAAQFATVTVDTETGQVTVDELVMAVDSGVIINPVTASGQIEGGMVQAAGYGAFEELAYDENGRIINPRFGPYWIYRADDVPDLTTIFIETYEETGPFGAKAVAEIPLDGAGPAIANAVYDAVGVLIKDAPLLPEKVWRALQEKK